MNAATLSKGLSDHIDVQALTDLMPTDQPTEQGALFNMRPLEPDRQQPNRLPRQIRRVAFPGLIGLGAPNQHARLCCLIEVSEFARPSDFFGRSPRSVC